MFKKPRCCLGFCESQPNVLLKCCLHMRSKSKNPVTSVPYIQWTPFVHYGNLQLCFSIMFATSLPSRNNVCTTRRAELHPLFHIQFRLPSRNNPCTTGWLDLHPLTILSIEYAAPRDQVQITGDPIPLLGCVTRAKEKFVPHLLYMFLKRVVFLQISLTLNKSDDVIDDVNHTWPKPFQNFR